MIPQLPASKMQAPVRRSYRDVVRDGTTENLQGKEAEAQTAKINKSSQKSSCVHSRVNEASTGSTCHGTDKVAEAPAAKLSNQPKNGAPEQGSKLAKKPGDGRKSSQQTSGETVIPVQESSQQQGCTAMEKNTMKKQNEPQKIPQPNKAVNDTNKSSSSCIRKVNVKAKALQVPVVEGMLTAHPKNTTTAAADVSVKSRLQLELKVSLPQVTAVKAKKKSPLHASNQNQPNKNTRNVSMKEEMDGNKGQVEKEKQDAGIIPAVPPEHKVHTGSRWHPFTVNQSCSRRVRCRHNQGRGLPPNVRKWCDECPNYLCETPLATTAKRATQEEGGDSHQ